MSRAFFSFEVIVTSCCCTVLRCNEKCVRVQTSNIYIHSVDHSNVVARLLMVPPPKLCLMFTTTTNKCLNFSFCCFDFNVFVRVSLSTSMSMCLSVCLVIALLICLIVHCDLSFDVCRSVIDEAICIESSLHRMSSTGEVEEEQCPPPRRVWHQEVTNVVEC